MAKDVYSRNKVFTKAEFDKETPVPMLWSDDRIPPLVTLPTSKPREQAEKISIQSLNQSQVKSVYTIDRQQFGKNVLEMMNTSSRTNKDNKTERMNVQTQQKPIDKEQIKNKRQQAVQYQRKKSEVDSIKKNYFNCFREEQKDYSQCPAVKLYRDLVENKIKQRQESKPSRDAAGQFQFQWMKDKKSSELLANVLTNPNRLNLYIHYLLNQIHLNEQARIINELHQEEIRQYNPNLKEIYSNVLCLLNKIAKTNSQERYSYRTNEKSKEKKRKGQEQIPKIALFENGVSIDLNPKLSEVKREKANRIRKLKMEISQNEQQFQQVKKYYQEIIMNYAIAIENMNKEDNSEGLLKPPGQGIQQSLVKLVVEEEEEEEGIRNKNHTFGMRHFSGRSSNQMKPRQK